MTSKKQAQTSLLRGTKQQNKIVNQKKTGTHKHRKSTKEQKHKIRINNKIKIIINKHQKHQRASKYLMWASKIFGKKYELGCEI